MSAGFTYRVKIDRTRILSLPVKQMEQGMTRMVTDLHSRATANAPIKTGALVNSGKFRQVGDRQWTVSFGGGRVPYARLREYENRLHPGTRFYLKRATEAVSAQWTRYFPGFDTK